MIVKFTVTTRCGARCKTCPVWKGRQLTMEYDRFIQAWDKLMASPLVTQVFVNSVGDLYSLPDHMRYLLYIESHKAKRVSITTNANVLDYVPQIDHFTISFNGGDRESYEYTTGLDYDLVVHNIRAAYPQLVKCGYREIDCLVWQGNKGCEKGFFDLWKDFPGARRVSYKVENQHGEYFGLPEYKDDCRIPCDYLHGMTLWPDGSFIRCAHDFEATDNYGNIFETDIKLAAMHPSRDALREAHKRGEYPGICATCNYNVSEEGKLIYLRR